MPLFMCLFLIFNRYMSANNLKNSPSWLERITFNLLVLVNDYVHGYAYGKEVGLLLKLSNTCLTILFFSATTLNNMNNIEQVDSKIEHILVKIGTKPSYKISIGFWYWSLKIENDRTY